MKHMKLLSLVGLACIGLTAQAQVMRIGFEADEAKGVYTTKDSTQFAGFFADHINLQPGDVWNEASTEAHSGEYALEVTNANTVGGYPWLRGFKIRNLTLEDATSYRISYWVKADPIYETAEGTQGKTSIKNSLSIGFENVEAPIVSPSGSEYYYNYTSGMTGEWRHVKNVTFFTNKATQDKYFSKYNGNIKEIIVNEETGVNDTIRYADGMDAFANQYFITINMYNPGTYYLDDIVLEKATIAGAVFNDLAVGIDFGYPTNIADLAKANGGSYALDPSCISVMYNGEPQTPDYVECKSDGRLYAFFESISFSSEDVLTVSFTGDSKILYTSDKRPSTDVESQLAVLPFSAENCDWDETIEVIPSAWSAPKLLSTTPENESFELDPATLKQVTMTFDRAIAIESASVVLVSNGKQRDLTSGISVAGDGVTLVIPFPSTLANGEYVIKVEGVENAAFPETTNVNLSFQVGADSDVSSSETVYSFASFMEEANAGEFPVGWVSNDGATIHQYGINEDGSKFNYNWGGTPGGGGSRIYSGFSGDFTKAIYWRCVSADVPGSLTYGAQVKDWMLPDGSIDPAMDPEIGLQLAARKYQISFRMAAWKGEPYYDFTLEDLEGNVIARFDDCLSAPNVNGVAGAVTGTQLMQTDFTVPTAGYYVLKFTSTGAWTEHLLAGVNLITMPSKAAYYKGLVKVAVDNAKAILETAAGAAYDGATKSALTDAINTAEAGGYTSPSQANALIALLNAKAASLQTRVQNIDNYNVAIIEAADKMTTIEGKYTSAPDYVAAVAVFNAQKDINPSTLSDEELVAKTPSLVNAAGLLGTVVECTDIRTYRVYKATQALELLTAVAEIDENVESAIAAGYEAVTDDDVLADRLNNLTKARLYEMLAADGTIAEDYLTTVMDDQNAENEVAKGVELTGFIKNPNFYTTSTNVGADFKEGELPGWMITGNVHGNGTSASATRPVSDIMINSYRNVYDLSQVINNLPVGVYDIQLNCRTSAGCNGTYTDEEGNELYDKFIYVKSGDKTYRKAFVEGGWGAHSCVIRGIEVTDGTITLGAIENYKSGANGEGDWDTNAFVDNARLYFAAPVAGFDYATSIATLKNDVEFNAVRREVYNLSGMRLEGMQKGINIVKFYDANGKSTTKKILVK